MSQMRRGRQEKKNSRSRVERARGYVRVRWRCSYCRQLSLGCQGVCCTRFRMERHNSWSIVTREFALFFCPYLYTYISQRRGLLQQSAVLQGENRVYVLEGTFNASPHELRALHSLRKYVCMCGIYTCTTRVYFSWRHGMGRRPFSNWSTLVYCFSMRTSNRFQLIIPNVCDCSNQPTVLSITKKKTSDI